MPLLVGRFSEPTYSSLLGTQSTKMAALGRACRDPSIHEPISSHFGGGTINENGGFEKILSRYFHRRADFLRFEGDTNSENGVFEKIWSIFFHGRTNYLRFEGDLLSENGGFGKILSRSFHRRADFLQFGGGMINENGGFEKILLIFFHRQEASLDVCALPVVEKISYF